MKLDLPDVVVELASSSGTNNGQPLEPDLLSHYSAVISVGSLQFAAQLRLESNLLAGLTAKVPVKFADPATALAAIGAGTEFKINDRGYQGHGHVLEVCAEPIRLAVISPAEKTDSEGWTLPEELNQPLPRKCRSTRVFKGICGIFLVFLLIPVWGLTSELFDEYSLEAFKKHGDAIDGRVTNMHSEMSRGRGAHWVYEVKYAYVLPTGSGSPTVYHRDTWIRSTDYQRLSIGGIIPVIYDPKEPGKSVLAVERTRGTRERYDGVFGLVFEGIFIAILGVPLAGLVAALVLEKRLLRWGSAACVVLLEEQDGAGMVRYSFRDRSGARVQGRSFVSKPAWGRITALQARGVGLVVLYDPADSTNNKLYPFEYATV